MASCTDSRALKIGVLAIQGAFYEHQACLLGAKEQVSDYKIDFTLEVVDVRTSDHLQGLDGIIIPGGESTVMAKSLEKDGFGDAVKSWMNGSSKPVVWGTCAGMILLAREAQHAKTGGQFFVSNYVMK